MIEQFDYCENDDKGLCLAKYGWKSVIAYSLLYIVISYSLLYIVISN